MTVERNIVCRDCNYRFPVKCGPEVLPVPCQSCGSGNTYSGLGAIPTKFRHRPGDTCGWALSGYTKEKHVDLGDFTAEDKRRAKSTIDTNRDRAKQVADA